MFWKNWRTKKEPVETKPAFEPTREQILEAKALLLRTRNARDHNKLRLAVARGYSDTFDASPALSRNPNLLEELDAWPEYVARKNFFISQVLKHEWSIPNCPDLERFMREQWSSKIDDILYHIAEYMFNGKFCLVVLPEERDYVWRHPGFVAAQEEPETEGNWTWWLVPTFGGSTVDTKPVPITQGRHMFSVFRPRDRNIGHGEGLIEAAYSLKRDWDEVRANWRAFMRKFSLPIFKWFYDMDNLDPTKDANSNQDTIDTFIEALTDVSTHVAIPCKMEEGVKLEDVEMLSPQQDSGMFREDFKRLTDSLEELITSTAMAMGLQNGQGSYGAVEQYSNKNVTVAVALLQKKVEQIMSVQFCKYRAIEEGFVTDDGLDPKFEFSKPVEPDNAEQVQCDIAKVEAWSKTNLPINEDELYRLLHIPKPNPESEKLVTPKEVMTQTQSDYPSPLTPEEFKSRLAEVNSGNEVSWDDMSNEG